MRLFAQQGYAATSMQQITTAAGVSAGAVYHYFPSKRSLMAATGQELAQAYRAPLERLLADGESIPSPAEVLDAIGSGLEQIHQGDGIDFTRIGIFTWAEALRDPELAVEVARVRQGLGAALAPVIAAWQRNGLVDPAADPADVLAALYGLMPGLSLQLNLSPGVVSAAGYRRGAVALFSGLSAR